MRHTAVTSILALSLSAGAALAEGEVNLYSSRHYDTDERLYSDFEAQTGITINRIEGKADELLARMEAEGANSPADVLITVDTSRLSRAKEMGLLQSVDSDILEERIPSNLQDADNDWFGFSQRARIIFYSKDAVDNPPQNYLDLADPAYEGQVCIRSSTNSYNQTLLAALVTHHGEEKATEWAQGVVNNMARDPEGGDTDQILGVASGECNLAVANHYYYVRLLHSDDAAEREAARKVGVIFPNQDDRGTHVNVGGAGLVANAQNPENGIRFLEFLASDQAQEVLAERNYEFPVVEGVKKNPVLESWGDFAKDDINISILGENNPEAVRIFDRVGWR